MLVKKLKTTIIISLLIILPLFAYAKGQTEEELGDLSKEELITMVEEGKTYIAELEEKLGEAETASRIDLAQENQELAEALIETVTALEESTTLIEDLKERIEEDQKEITELRDKLQQSLIGLSEYKYFEIGVGITQPLGGELILGVNLPRIPLGFFTSMSVMKPDDTTVDITIGAGLKIRF